MSIERHQSNQRTSRIVVYNDVIYLSGQVAKDASQCVKGQTQQILNQIEDLLHTVDGDKSTILSVTIWLSDIALFQEMNSVWDEWVGGENPPARACVEGRLARPELLVEMKVIAARQEAS